MKLMFELSYENEKITDFDVAKEIVVACNSSYYSLNPRKIAEMILIQVKDGNLEKLWQELKDYLEQTKFDYCDNGDVLRVIQEMENKNN